MVNEDAPDLETLVEDSRNPHAVRQYIAMSARIAALEAQLAASEAKCAELEGQIACRNELRNKLAAALARAEEAERKFAAIDEYEIVNAMQGPLWDAISKFTMACGGDTSRYVYGNTPRMNAVGEVNAVIRAALRQAMGVRGDD